MFKNVQKSNINLFFSCTAANKLLLERRSVNVKKLSDNFYFCYAVKQAVFIRLDTHQSTARLRSSTAATCPTQTTVAVGKGHPAVLVRKFEISENTSRFFSFVFSFSPFHLFGYRLLVNAQIAHVRRLHGTTKSNAQTFTCIITFLFN